jgi:HEAT repeat protein
MQIFRYVSHRFRYRFGKLSLKTTALGRGLVILFCLVLFWGWLGSSLGLAQSFSDVKYPDLRITPLIEKLTVADPRIRRTAADALVKIGPPALPALITALQSADVTLRWTAASVLGDLGSDAAEAAPILALAIQDPDPQVRLYAIIALGDIGPAAATAIPELTQALQDSDPIVRVYAPLALRKMGAAAKVAIPDLVTTLQDANGRVRLNAAYALGEMGTDAATAIPALETLLGDPLAYVRFGALKGLAGIAQGFQDQAGQLSTLKLGKVIAEFEAVLKQVEGHPERFPNSDQVYLRRPLNALKAEQDSRFLGRLQEWLRKNKWVFGSIVYVLGLPSLWLLLLRLAPLRLLQINNALRPYTDLSLPVIGLNLPLRFVLFLSWFHYHPRVLDAWVNQYAAQVRQQFAQKQTVQARSVYLPLPVQLGEHTLPSLQLDHLRPIFARQRSCLVIWGEGGLGKTSVACQLANLALAASPPQRLCPHLMLPVLIEEDLRPVEGKSALLEAIRGQLQVLMDVADPLCEELLLRLLRQRRILVIIDRFSELSPATQAAIQPESPDFPINALILTSQVETALGRANKTSLTPLRLQPDQLTPFLEAYLQARTSAERLTQPSVQAVSQQLAQLVGTSRTTVLLVKLFAEAWINSNPLHPEVILPELILNYLNELNRDITDTPLANRTLHQAAKGLAWACLQTHFTPQPIRRDLALTVIGQVEPIEGEPLTPNLLLDYLEHRLKLVETIGAAQEQVQFCLDPLVTYLAAMALTEQLGHNDAKWRSGFFKRVDEVLKATSAEGVAGLPGFLWAVHTCYVSQPEMPESSPVVSAIEQRLAKLSAQPSTAAT